VTEAPVGLVADLWRFPVKSFGGERVRRAFLGPFGLLGDRRHAVVDGSGALSARRAGGLLGYRARYADAEAAERAVVITPEGDELPWDDPRLAAEVGASVGRDVALAASHVGIHDAAPVHLVTTASLAAAAVWLGEDEIDRRRFRANVIVELEEDEPFAEAGWLGQTLALGDGGPVVRVVSPTERCVVTTYDPDTLERDKRIQAALARERENLFGVYASVVRPGWLAVGATVRLVGSGVALT
jgi:uncharacterized protein YcbX